MYVENKVCAGGGETGEGEEEKDERGEGGQKQKDEDMEKMEMEKEIERDAMVIKPEDPEMMADLIPSISHEEKEKERTDQGCNRVLPGVSLSRQIGSIGSGQLVLSRTRQRHIDFKALTCSLKRRKKE